MPNLAEKVVRWQKQHGRHNLPWQIDRSPYRVWLSEVMLQQTQVQTVIPYYLRFLEKCPRVEDLAALSTDELMRLWQGLGYYSRARNLHKASQMIVNDYQGLFPRTREELIKLPGVGRSTAAAIMSLAYQVPDAILDGNVKRVLCRYHGIRDNPKATTTINKLWDIATTHLSSDDPRAYTQGLMDLGANLCKRTNPSCQHCPLNDHCQAFHDNTTHLIPAKAPKREVRKENLYLLISLNNGHIGLSKRPKTGIWGDLYTPMVFDEYEALANYQPKHTPLSHYNHQLTHIKFTIYPYITTDHDQGHTIYEPLTAIKSAIPTGIHGAIEQAQAWLSLVENP